MYIDASTRLKQKLLHYHSSRSIEKDFTIKNLNKIIDMLFSFQCANTESYIENCIMINKRYRIKTNRKISYYSV